MHQVTVRPEIIERVLARRGRHHLFDSLNPKETAFVVIDMQSTFVEPGSPAEVPASRGIVDNINSCAAELRALGGTVIWVNHANAHNSSASDWDMFFNHFVSEDIRKKTIESLSPDGEGQKVWHELNVEKDDLHIIKNRYSALISGSSSLERTLRSRTLQGVDEHQRLHAGSSHPWTWFQAEYFLSSPGAGFRRQHRPWFSFIHPSLDLDHVEGASRIRSSEWFQFFLARCGVAR